MHIGQSMGHECLYTKHYFWYHIQTYTCSHYFKNVLEYLRDKHSCTAPHTKNNLVWLCANFTVSKYEWAILCSPIKKLQHKYAKIHCYKI